MEFVMYVPRVFNIKIKQFEKYLLNNGWKRDVEYYDELFRFTPIKEYDIQIVIPAHEDVDLLDKKIMMKDAITTLAAYMNETLESTVESIQK